MKNKIGIRKHNICYNLAICAILLGKTDKTVKQLFDFYSVKSMQELNSIKNILLHEINERGFYFNALRESAIFTCFRLSKYANFYQINGIK